MNTPLDLDYLRVFEAIARCGSVTAAARKLYRSPSTVSYIVRRLESTLGVTLLDRSGHRANLTPQGKMLVAEARSLLAQAERITHKIRRADAGWEPEIGIAISDLVPPGRVLSLLKHFYAVSPDTRIRLTHEVLSGGWDALAGGRADLTLGVSVDGAPPLPLEIRSLGQIRFIFVAAPDHPLARIDAPIGIEALRQHRAIAVSDTSRNLPVRTLRILEAQPVLSVPDQETKREAILAGLGVGFLPERLIADDLARRRLVAPRLSFADSSTHELCYAWHAGESGRGLAWLTDYLADEVHYRNWHW